MVVTNSGDALHLLRLILDTPWHEVSVVEQRYKAVLAVIAEGRTVTDRCDHRHRAPRVALGGRDGRVEEHGLQRRAQIREAAGAALRLGAAGAWTRDLGRRRGGIALMALTGRPGAGTRH